MIGARGIHDRTEICRRPPGIEESDVPLLLELPLFSSLAREEVLDLVSEARVAAALAMPRKRPS